MNCDVCGNPIRDDEHAYRYLAVVGTVDATTPVETIPPSGEHVTCVDAKRKGQRVRIVADGPTFDWARVLIVQPDGSEVPIFPSIIRSLMVKVGERDWNVATVEFEGVEIDMYAHANESAPVLR